MLNTDTTHLVDFIPWQRESLEGMLASFRDIADPELILFAEVDGQPVGWLPALPNLNEAFQHANGLRYPWDYLKLAWFGFLIGIPVFILGSWVFISGLRSHSGTSLVTNSPLVDEWIGEQGKEEIERNEWGRMFTTAEKLLALVAVREEQGPNRLAVTDKRVMIYPQDNIENMVSYDYGQIEAFRGKRNTPLVHLGEIILSVKGNKAILKNVGMEYVDQIVELITRMKRLVISLLHSEDIRPAFHHRYHGNRGT